MQVFDAIGIERLRVATDGEGVTTLIAAYGCPLRCKYCLNPQCFEEGYRTTGYTPEELYEQVKKDAIYFTATGGGLTFGGGEPLLRTDFIAEFKSIADSDWRFTAETCLNVPKKSVEKALMLFDLFMIDIKDMDPGIYTSYTGRENTQVKENLTLIAENGRAGDCLIRIPLIPGFNTEEDRKRSAAELEQMGFTRFNFFEYVIRNKKRTDSNN